MSKIGNDRQEPGAAVRTDEFDYVRLMGSLGLGVLMALSTASCSTIQNMSRTITPNAYSESVGPEKVKADEDE